MQQIKVTLHRTLLAHNTIKEAWNTPMLITVYHIIQAMNPKQTIQGDKHSNGIKEANPSIIAIQQCDNKRETTNFTKDDQNFLQIFLPF
mgnify:CR=1 FL=1